MFDGAIFDSVVFDVGGILPPSVVYNGRGKEYQPTYHELRERREIERRFEEAQLNLKSTQIKIENLELKRLQDLADQTMQMELLMLLSAQQELVQLIDQLQQQKLRALNDDDDFLAILMCLPI